jgi:hypothetical protein
MRGTVWMLLPILAAMLATANCKGSTMGFDKAVWAAERGNLDGDSRRSAMVAALPDAGIQAGASRASVHALLGVPDSTSATNDRYHLGRAGYGIDSETLRIDYDDNDRILGTTIERG